jgi:hypothetical protein
MKKSIDTIIPLTLLCLICFSIIVTYYSKMVMRDYEILYSETGLPELDEE